MPQASRPHSLKSLWLLFEPLNYGVANHLQGRRKQHHLHETEKNKEASEKS